MIKLEQAFAEYLEEQINGRDSVEVRVKDIRNSLIPKFISDDHTISKLNLEISRLVSAYRHKKKLLQGWTVVCTYMILKEIFETKI